MLEVRPVVSEADALLFTDLPYRLYAGNPYWVPPLRADELAAFTPGRNPALDFCDVCRWVAVDDGVCVGRVAAIVNPLWNQKYNSHTGRFSRFECVDRRDVAHTLLLRAEEWLFNRGMDSVAGPLGFSNLDQQGFTLMGFEREAALGSSLTLPHYVPLIQGEGYVPLQDWFEYRLTVPDRLPDKVALIADAACRNFGLGLVSMKSVDDVRRHAPAIMDLFNVAFAPLFGTYHFTDELKKYYVDRYMSIIDPRLVVAVEDLRDPARPIVGFMIAIPSVTKALRKAKGSIGVFDACNIWLQRHRSSEAEILLAGVRPDVRRRGAFSLMVKALIESFIHRGITAVETTAILDGNDRASTIVKMFPYERHKHKRCFVKSL